MKKAIAILLTALLMLTVFVSCEGDVEDMFGKTVSFNGNGSTSGQMAEMKVKKGEEVTLPANEFTRTDYVFAGWNTQADGSGTGYADKAKASFDDNTVLYAQWIEEVTITFDGNGSTDGEMAALKVKKGEDFKLTKNAFEKTNYIFTGWNTAADGSGTAYANEGTAKFDKDTTLYAQWIEELTITFNANDGSETPATKTQKVGKGIETALDKNTFELSGFTFTKWNTMKDGSGTNYADGVVKTFDSDLELYAQWAANTDTPYVVNHYTKNLSDDKYTLSSTDNKTDTTGVLLVLENLKKTIEGFTYDEGFSGTETKGTTKPSSGAVTEAEVLGEGNLVIDLYYSRDSHTVALTKGDNISAITGAGTYAYGESVSVEATIDSGYKLANWIVTGETTEVSTDNPYVFTMGASDVAYTANATPISYTVAFNKNNESATGTMESQSFTYGTAQNLTENGFQYEGKYFGGWATTTSGEKAYSDKQSVSNLTTTDGDTVTLYAIWTDTPPITIIKNTEGTLTLTSGDYTIEDATVTVTGRITIDGSVNLLLPDGKTLNANSGITVSSGNTLVIDKFDSESTGTGTLNATGVNNSAGIGGTDTQGNRDGGTVTINGGIVTANGGENAAGIGGGVTGNGGTVYIFGGNVTAIGGGLDSYGGAGIGGGVEGNGGTVTISGGTVTATGGASDKGGAGIGGGYHKAGGTVAINGGTVIANGNGGGAGIGGGFSGSGGNIAITGGTVTATGGSSGAGIGAGNGSSDHGALTIGTGYVLTGGSASADTLLLGPVDSETTYTGAHPQYMNASAVSEIKDSTSAITLKSGVYTTDKTDTEVVVSDRITVEGSVFLLLPDGAKLTASKGITVSSGNTLVIDKYGSTATETGTLTATGTNYAAGIGGGDGGSCGTIAINGGTVTATGGSHAAGIGGGYNGAGGTISISGGDVKATGGYKGAGIGGGYNGAGGTISIRGGDVEATGGYKGAGIGGGSDGSGGEVTINGGTVTANGGEDAVGIGAGNGSSDHGDLTITDGVIMMVSTNNTDWSVYSETRTRYMRTPTILTSSTKAWQNDVYSLADNLEISSRITVSGNVTLILPAGKTLTASDGITVSTGNSLTIGGTGTLTVTAPYAGRAGIGGDGYNPDGGIVTINGGKVTANGGMDGAGIGGAGEGAGGTVTINGGTVTATGGENAAGIGAGNGSSDHGALTIGIGYVLTGGSTSADTLLLGPVDSETTYTGDSHPRYMNVSTVSEIKNSTSAITLKSGVYTTDKNDTEVVVSERITVEGSVFLLLPDGKTLTASKGITVSTGNSLTIGGTGTLTVTAPDEGNAGIGGGYNGAGGTVTISSGTVTATGGQYAAGIGGGNAGAGGTVTITGGTVTATGGYLGTGIGGGYFGAGVEVTITGGIVKATGGDRAAGIGGGDRGAGGEISISGGSVTAKGGSQAAGIGGGWKRTGGTISISGGAVEATGGSDAAGIGGGDRGAGGEISINGGTVKATGGGRAAGIGGGWQETGGTISISGGDVEATGGNDGVAGIGGGADSSSHGTLTIGAGVTVWVKDSEGASWESYVEDVRHRYMKAEEGI